MTIPSERSYLLVSDPNIQYQRELASLERLACCRKVAINTAAAVCCPLSNVCCFFCACLSCVDSSNKKSCDCTFFCTEEDDKGTGYCDWTTCESPCCHGANDPKDTVDLIKLVCNPFICFPCCSKEISYNTGPERQRMDLCRQKISYVETSLQAEINLHVKGLGDDVTGLIADFAKEPAKTIRKIQPPERKTPPSRSDWTPVKFR